MSDTSVLLKSLIEYKVSWQGKETSTVHEVHSTHVFQTLGIKLHIDVYLILLGLFTETCRSEEARGQQ